MAYCGGGVLVAALIRRSDELMPLLRSYWSATSATATSFWREHVVAPATLMWRELVHRDYLHVSDPRALQQADEVLHILLRQFRETWSAELEKARAQQGTLEGSADQAATQTATAFAAAGGGSSGGGIGGAAAAAAPRWRRARAGAAAVGHIVEGEMGAISRLFGAAAVARVQHGAGPPLQMLIIQTQYMKQQLLQQMAAMDRCSRTSSRPRSQRCCPAPPSSSRPSRRCAAAAPPPLAPPRALLVKQVRSVLRDVERPLIVALPPPRAAVAAAAGAVATTSGAQRGGRVVVVGGGGVGRAALR